MADQQRMTSDELRAWLAKTMTEDQLLAKALGELRAAGWRVVHSRPARSRDGKRVMTPIQGHRGQPDLLAARNGMTLHVELKSEKGTLDEDQRRWLTALAGAEPADRWNSRGPEPTSIRRGTLYVAVWRPRHLSAIRQASRLVPSTDDDLGGSPRPGRPSPEEETNPVRCDATTPREDNR